jgi:D-alanine-D-alanine ligase
VKPNAEGTSKGIYETSKATTPDAANSAVQKLRTMFPNQDVLVELFLDGREFTAAIVGSGTDTTEVLAVVEYIWSTKTADFLCYENKSNDVEVHQRVSGRDDAEVARVETIAKLAWTSLRCRDGGRVDIRSYGKGQSAVPMVMEVNPNPLNKLDDLHANAFS